MLTGREAVDAVPYPIPSPSLLLIIHPIEVGNEHYIPDQSLSDSSRIARGRTRRQDSDRIDPGIQ